MNEIVISEVQIVPIKPLNGFLGFASCTINNQFFIGGLGIYSSPISPKGFRVTFPIKKLANGRIVYIFHPINQQAGQVVSDAIIKKYLELMDNFDNVEVI